MKKLVLLIVLVVLVMIPAKLPASVMPHTSTPIVDSNIPDNGTTTSPSEASNSSASDTITITMTGVLSGQSSD